MASTSTYDTESATDYIGLTDNSAAEAPRSLTPSEGWPKTSSPDGTSPASGLALPLPPLLTWNEAVAKGYRMLDVMENPSPTPSLPFTTDSLENHGYHTTTRSVQPIHHHYPLLQRIVPEREPDAREVQSRHTRTTVTDDGTIIPATEAFFVNTFDTTSGTIIAGSNFNPSTCLSRPLNEGESYPALQHWSDIVVLQLQKAATAIAESDSNTHTDTHTDTRTDATQAPSTTPSNPLMPNLTHILRYSIENPHTNAIIHTLIQHHTGAPCSTNIWDTGCPHCCPKVAFPGVTFGMDTEGAVALLGTPNGSGVAWLLAQHEELFGRKTVGKVTVYCDVQTDVVLRANLLFHIEDGGVVEEGEEKEEGGEDGEDGEGGGGYFDVDEYRKFCEGD